TADDHRVMVTTNALPISSWQGVYIPRPSPPEVTAPSSNNATVNSGSIVPTVGDPGLADQASDDDDRVGEGDECVVDASSAFGADQEFFEAAGVSGVRAFLYSAVAGLQRFALGADLPITTQF